MSLIRIRDLALEARRRQDRELIEAIRVRLAPPFRPAVRIEVDNLGRLRLIIGVGPGWLTTVVDPAQLGRYTPEKLAAIILEQGRRELAAAGITVVEPNITLGEE